MFDRTEIIVGLEIGTAKVCAVVVELSEDEGLHVIGLGQSPSVGAVSYTHLTLPTIYSV